MPACWCYCQRLLLTGEMEIGEESERKRATWVGGGGWIRGKPDRANKYFIHSGWFGSVSTAGYRRPEPT